MKLKITVQPDALKDAVVRIATVPDGKSPLDTHHNVSLVAADKRTDVRVFASGPTFCASAVIAGAEREGHGHITLPADQFKSLVGNLSHIAQFKLSDDDKTSMNSPGWNCKLPTIVTSLATPKMATPFRELSLRIEALTKAVDAAIAISERGAWRGIETDVVVLHFKDHTKPFVFASDSKQFIMVSLPVTSEEAAEGLVLKVPEKAAKSMLSFFRGQEGLVRIRYTENVVSMWDADGNICFINLMAGASLPVEKVRKNLDAIPVTRVTVPKVSLVQAVRRAALAIKNDMSMSVLLTAKDGSLTAECESDSSGESLAEIEGAAVDGDDTRIWVNCEELLIALAKLDAESLVLSIGHGDSALYIDCPPAWWSIAATVPTEGVQHAESKATK